MRVMLDTRSLVRLLCAPDELSGEARELVERDDVEVVVSAASILELAERARSGEVELPAVLQVVERRGWQALGLDVTPLCGEAVWAAGRTEMGGDLFFRLVLAHARMEAEVLVTRRAVEELGLVVVRG